MTRPLTLHKQLQAIFDQHGKMTPQILLREIERPDHPMHDEIDWSKEHASGHPEVYRLAQARDIIRAHKLIYGELAPTASEPTTRPQREEPRRVVRPPVRTGPLMPGDPIPEDPPKGPLWVAGVILLFVLAGIVLGALGSWLGWL